MLKGGEGGGGGILVLYLVIWKVMFSHFVVFVVVFPSLRVVLNHKHKPARLRPITHFNVFMSNLHALFWFFLGGVTSNKPITGFDVPVNISIPNRPNISIKMYYYY